MKRHVTRGQIIFIVGLGGIVIELANQIIRDRAVDPTILLIFGAMIGLPKVLEVVAENGKNGKKT